MNNISKILSDSIASLQPVSNSRNAEQTGDFQKYMDDTGKIVQNTRVAKTATETKVSREPKQMETQETTQETAVQNGSKNVPEEIPHEDMEQVEEAVSAVVRDVLHMDEQALETVLEQMGISLVQLLEPDTLKQFVVAVNPGSDVTDLLTNETMLGQFTDLLQGMQEIDWESLTGMSQEQFTRLLQNLSEQGLQVQNIPEQALEDAVQQGTQVLKDEVETTDTKEQIPVQAEQMVSEEENLSGQITDTEASRQQGNPQKTVTVSQTDGSENLSAVQDNPVAAKEGEQEQQEQQGQSQLFDQSGRTSAQITEQAVQQPTTVMDFVENMMQAVDTTQDVDGVKMQQMIDIVNQVVEKIHATLQDGTTTMEMQLNPESLGRVLLSVTNKNGVMTASFTVQTTEAKEALESQMFQLREAIEQKNLKVESVEVSVSDFTFSQSNQADTGDQKDFNQGHGKRMRFQFEEEEQEDAASEAEQVRRSVMGDSGSRVDYTA